MTTKKELLAEIAELLAKIAELQAKVDEMPDEFKIETVRACEILSDNEMYYVSCADGETVVAVWDGMASDRGRLENGQVFLTRGAAQREAKRRQLWHKCRKAMRDAWQEFGEMPDWSKSTLMKFVVGVSKNDIVFRLHWLDYERIHFPTEESRSKWYSTVTHDDIRLMLIEEW